MQAPSLPTRDLRLGPEGAVMTPCSREGVGILHGCGHIKTSLASLDGRKREVRTTVP